MLGNHRDAWVFGAADASSGTAAMMELSRVLGQQLKKGMPCSGQSTMLTKNDFKNITLRMLYIVQMNGIMSHSDTGSQLTSQSIFRMEAKAHIVLLSWGAEEPQYMGSVEQIEVSTVKQAILIGHF